MRTLLIFLLAGTVFVSALKVVVAQHQARKLFIEIQVLEKQRDRLNEEWGRLQLEQSTWATDDRIESIARSRLGMVAPNADSLVLLRR